MDMNLLHDVTFYVMYAAMAIAIFIAIERGIYFAYVRRQARALIDALGTNVHSERDLPENLTRRDSLPLNMILPVLAQKATHGSRKDLDDEIDTQYLKTRAHWPAACGSSRPSPQPPRCWACWVPFSASSTPSRHWPPQACLTQGRYPVVSGRPCLPRD